MTALQDRPPTPEEVAETAAFYRHLGAHAPWRSPDDAEQRSLNTAAMLEALQARVVELENMLDWCQAAAGPGFHEARVDAACSARAGAFSSAAEHADDIGATEMSNWCWQMEKAAQEGRRDLSDV